MLTLIALLCALGGLAQIGFAYVAFLRQASTQSEIEKAVVGLTDAMKGELAAGSSKRETGEEEDGEAVFGEAAGYVRALADLAEKLAGVTPPVAALLISTIPFFLGAALAAIAELHS
jgi:hypothetical protein